MSRQARDWAWSQPLPHKLKSTLCALAELARPDGRCWPTAETLAARMGVTERTVRAHLSDLSARGLIEVTRRGPAASEYRLKLVPLANGHDDSEESGWNRPNEPARPENIAGYLNGTGGHSAPCNETTEICGQDRKILPVNADGFAGQDRKVLHQRPEEFSGLGGDAQSLPYCEPEREPERKEERGAPAAPTPRALVPVEGVVSNRVKEARLPSDWQPSRDDRAYAASAGFTAAETDAIAENFRDWFGSKATRRSDWGGPWRTWIRGDAERRQRSMTLLRVPRAEANGFAALALARDAAEGSGDIIDQFPEGRLCHAC